MSVDCSLSETFRQNEDKLNNDSAYEGFVSVKKCTLGRSLAQEWWKKRCKLSWLNGARLQYRAGMSLASERGKNQCPESSII